MGYVTPVPGSETSPDCVHVLKGAQESYKSVQTTGFDPPPSVSEVTALVGLAVGGTGGTFDQV
jgi:tetrahydromethanopterin S-methyltransferase subunit D